MSNRIQDNDVARDFLKNLSDSSALDSPTKAALCAVLGACPAALILDHTPVTSTNGTSQVETATALGTATANGGVNITLTSVGFTGMSQVGVAIGDTPTLWAAKVRAVLGLNEAITHLFAIGGTGADIVLTAKAAAANDATLNLAIDPTAINTVGITSAPTSVNTTPGVAPTGDIASQVGQDAIVNGVGVYKALTVLPTTWSANLA
jgi:hypothetical protein